MAQRHAGAGGFVSRATQRPSHSHSLQEAIKDVVLQVMLKFEESKAELVRRDPSMRSWEVQRFRKLGYTTWQGWSDTKWRKLVYAPLEQSLGVETWEAAELKYQSVAKGLVQRVVEVKTLQCRLIEDKPGSLKGSLKGFLTFILGHVFSPETDLTECWSLVSTHEVHTHLLDAINKGLLEYVGSQCRYETYLQLPNGEWRLLGTTAPKTEVNARSVANRDEHSQDSSATHDLRETESQARRRRHIAQTQTAEEHKMTNLPVASPPAPVPAGRAMSTVSGNDRRSHASSVVSKSSRQGRNEDNPSIASGTRTSTARSVASHRSYVSERSQRSFADEDTAVSDADTRTSRPAKRMATAGSVASGSVATSVASTSKSVAESRAVSRASFGGRSMLSQTTVNGRSMLSQTTVNAPLSIPVPAPPVTPRAVRERIISNPHTPMPEWHHSPAMLASMSEEEEEDAKANDDEHELRAHGDTESLDDHTDESAEDDEHEHEDDDDEDEDADSNGDLQGFVVRDE